MCLKIQQNSNSLISSYVLIYLVHEFSPMALLIEWLPFLNKLHLIVHWFASDVGLFYLLTSEAPLLGLDKSIYYGLNLRKVKKPACMWWCIMCSESMKIFWFHFFTLLSLVVKPQPIKWLSCHWQNIFKLHFSFNNY